MRAPERRQALLKALCLRRFDTIANLAVEFAVSERTIRRDIEILSTSEPIYTQTGRYGGGVYIMDDYHMSKAYFREAETMTLQKILACLEREDTSSLNEADYSVLRHIISSHQKPIKS